MNELEKTDVMDDRESKVLDFRSDLENLINQHSMENASNTPDFILADYLRSCLDSFDVAVIGRDKWYDFNTKV